MNKQKKHTRFQFFPEKISNAQAQDTGMAMVLIALIVGLSTGNKAWFIAALVMLVINMTVPKLYTPVAKVWLGFSLLLGSIVSKIVLSVVFFLIITPMGFIKKKFGSEPLNLKKYKTSTDSVFTLRNQLFTAKDIENPY